MSVVIEERGTDFSFETFDFAYHALEGFDSFLWIFAGAGSITCEVVRDCLYNTEFTFYILLS
jgi:hypothetical protein